MVIKFLLKVNNFSSCLGYNVSPQKKKTFKLLKSLRLTPDCALKISTKKVVTYFKEKSSLHEGWINGGFFVLEPEIFKYIKDDKTYFEREPLQKLSRLKSLYAYKHSGFWQCMDTLRDKEILEKKIKKWNVEIVIFQN